MTDPSQLSKPGNAHWVDRDFSDCTWLERLYKIIFHAVLATVTVGLAIGALLLFGSIFDGVTRYNVEHDSCLRHATNGLEIERCR